MIRLTSIACIVLLFLAFSLSTQVAVAQDKFELVKFETEDGGSIEASLFKASESKIVIFAHGVIFNKESWYFLAEKFQKEGVSALPLDFRGYGNSQPGSTDKKLYDIIGAIAFAEEQGYSDINIIGASMGGAAVLGALSSKEVLVSKVVLLAPAGGSVIISSSTRKLFGFLKRKVFTSKLSKFLSSTYFSSFI